MKYLFLTAACLMGLLSLPACHKHHAEPKQYSTWIVNGQDTFRTNDVDSSIDCNPDHSYCVASLTSHGPNRFSLAFDLDYFPVQGKYIVMYSSQGSPPNGFQFCAIKIYYNNQYYYRKSSANFDTLYASSENSKITYTLPPMWFANYDNPTGDSVVIEGTFNLP